MFDSLSQFISLISTVIGMAGAFVFGMLIFLIVVISKRMPSGWRKAISAIATTFVFLTIFSEITTQSIYILAYKSIFSFDVFSAIVFTLFISIYIILLVETVFRQNKNVFCEVLSFDVKDEKYIANKKKLSSPSSFLKVSSVILQ